MSRTAFSGLVSLTVVLTAAGFADAATCTSRPGAYDWADASDDHFDCEGESAADDFVIVAGSKLTVTGDINLDAGSIWVSGGELVLSPAGTIGFVCEDENDAGGVPQTAGARDGKCDRDADYSYWGIDSGKIVRKGIPLLNDRVLSVAWSGCIDLHGGGGAPQLGGGPDDLCDFDGATSVHETFVVRMPEPVGSVSAGMWMVMLDDDPPFGRALSRPPQTDAGPPQAGRHRDSYSKYRWFYVAHAEGDRVTLYHYQPGTWDCLDDGTCNNQGAFQTPPYAGTYGAAATGSSSRPLMAVTARGLDRNGLATKLRVGSADVAVDGDLGDQYVYHPNDTSGDPRCRRGAKIIMGYENHPLADEIHVAGDVTACTGAIAVHYGVEAGDPVVFVEPQQIDHGYLGHFLFQGGELEWRFVSDIKLGSHPREGPRGLTAHECSFCAYHGQIEAHSGFVDYWNSAFHQEKPGSNGFMAVLFTGLDRVFPGNPQVPSTIDFSGFEIRHLYVHDQMDDVGTGDLNDGLSFHGFWVAGASNRASCLGCRVERLGDDGLGGEHAPVNAGEEHLVIGHRWHSLANLATVDNSQQGLEFAHRAAGRGDEHSILEQFLDLTDITTIGAYSAALDVEGQNNRINRIVNGGGFKPETSGAMIYGLISAGPALGCRGPGDPHDCCTGRTRGRSCDYPLAGASTHPTIVSNALDLGAGVDSSRARVLGGILRDSISVCDQITDIDGFDNLVGIENSYVDFCQNSVGFGMARIRNSDRLYVPVRPHFSHSVVRQSNAGARFCADEYQDVALSEGTTWEGWDIEDSFISTEGWPYFGLVDDCVVTGLGSPTVGYTIDGLYAAALTPQARGLGDGYADVDMTGSGQQVQRACIETQAARDSQDAGYGSNPTDTSIHVTDLEPNGTVDAELPAYVEDPGVADPAGCESYKPDAVGLAELGTAHSMLGSALMADLHKLSWQKSGRPRFTLDGAGGGNGECNEGPSFPDEDIDDVLDALDNCLGVSNPDQLDSDADGYGNQCDPDLNNDGRVAMPDFLAFSRAFGRVSGEPDFDPDADFTGDGLVGYADIFPMWTRFGGTPGPSGLACAGDTGGCAAVCAP